MGKRRVARALTGVITVCKLCNQTKDDAFFKWQDGKRAGLVCVECDLEKKRNLYASSPEERARAKAAAAKWARENPEVHREGLLRRRATEEVKEKRRQEYQNNKQKCDDRVRKWVAGNKQQYKETCRAWREANRDKLIQKSRSWYAANREKVAIQNKKWRTTNRGRAVAHTRAYMLCRDYRTPVWADSAAIIKFYENCPEGYEVDHVVPLRGKIVSGLHVLENLQYLTVAQNRHKGNKFSKEDGGW